MMTPTDERKDDKSRVGMVQVSDGKSRPLPARLVLSMEAITVQRPAPAPASATAPARSHTGRDEHDVPTTRERMVQIRRDPSAGLGLSIKGGAEHKLPVLISHVYRDTPAARTGQLYVGDAVIKVNGEYITACSHDDAVSILRDAGDLVVLTVRHYRQATPFLTKHNANGDGVSPVVVSDSESSAGSERAERGVSNAPSPSASPPASPSPSPCAAAAPAGDSCNGVTDCGDTNGWQWGSSDSRASRRGSRPVSAGDLAAISPKENTHWVDVVSVPLMMGYVTRYVHGTDKLRPAAFQVVGARPRQTTGVVHAADPAALSAWLKGIGDNIAGLTLLQMKLLNRQLSCSNPGAGRIEYMGWVHEGVPLGGGWQSYRPVFLVLVGTDCCLFQVPPMTAGELTACADTLPVYQTMFRTVKESETVDWRAHCFLLQGSGGGVGGGGAAAGGPRYFSAETRQELLRVEQAWTTTVVQAVVRLGRKTFTVVSGGRAASLTLDWSAGFQLASDRPGAQPLWAYRFSALRGSSDDGKSKLKLHFQDPDTKLIETKELECQILQSLLFCMHAFLTAKVASVDPAFLAAANRPH